VKAGGNLWVGLAGRDGPEDLQLAAGQVGVVAGTTAAGGRRPIATPSVQRSTPHTDSERMPNASNSAWSSICATSRRYSVM